VNRDSRARIVVTGLLAQYPLGGVTWDYIQYVVGLSRLGHDVYYIEDTDQYPYNPHEGGISNRCDDNVRHLASVMSRYGLEDRWAYCFPWQTQWFGMSEQRRLEVVRSADLLLNVSGVLARPDLYRMIPRLAFIDSDPGFTQVKLANGQIDFARHIDMHDVHFSFGETLPGNAPDSGHDWRPTRQPILLDEWRTDLEPRPVFTTVMNWTSYRPLSWDGRDFGQKDREFRRFMDLPQRVAPTALEVAVGAGKNRRAPLDLLAHRGWRVVDPTIACPDLDTYRHYVQTSLAEWSVAKGGYVVGRTGWFSCRSACYLAAGRPAVVQETGFSEVLPTGEGILAFNSMEESVEAVREVRADYERHAAAASELAAEYFGASRVLTNLVDTALEAAPVAAKT
jgi:hypothetical protein